jgi:hypothetical protein
MHRWIDSMKVEPTTKPVIGNEWSISITSRNIGSTCVYPLTNFQLNKGPTTGRWKPCLAIDLARASLVRLSWKSPNVASLAGQ